MNFRLKRKMDNKIYIRGGDLGGKASGIGVASYRGLFGDVSADAFLYE